MAIRRDTKGRFASDPVASLETSLKKATGSFAKDALRIMKRIAKDREDMRLMWKGSALELRNRFVDPTIGIHPIDTGFAKGSWKIYIMVDEPLLIRISNGAHYIVWLELGSSKRQPNGWVRREIRSYRQEIMQAARRRLSRGS